MEITQKNLPVENHLEKEPIIDKEFKQMESDYKTNLTQSNGIIAQKRLYDKQPVPVQDETSDGITVGVRKAIKKILVVDDVESIVMTVKMFLERHCYEVITANDGQEGLEKARTEEPDLIILDLMLPKMDGYKLCGLLKKDTRYAKTPIILFTAAAQEESIKLGQEIGADAYINKPFEPELLLSKIEELIGK